MIRTITIFILLTVSCLTFAQPSENSFTPSGEPIVQIFSTPSYNINNNTFDFTIGRAHLGYQYQFSQKWSAKVIIDRGRPTSSADVVVIDSLGNEYTVHNTVTDGAYYTMFLKFASLQWKINPQLTIEGGAILQNHDITQERFWGMRYVVQTFQDLHRKIPSADLGFITHYKPNSIFSVYAAIK